MTTKMIKAVNYDQPYFRNSNRPLGGHIDRLSLLRRSGMNFIPYDGNGRTIRTTPLLEDNIVSWKERYVEAALIYLTNPLCFAATNLIADELANARIVVEELQSDGKWKEHKDNALADWLPTPNSTMDIKEFIRAYATHFHTFGSVNAFMFQKGDILPNGKINQETNCFDIIFPGRLAEDPVSNPFEVEWWYLPIGYETPLKLNNESLFIDVVYNPIAHSLGVSYPNSPLEKIFRIHNLYIQVLEKFFTTDAVPQFLLTRIVDITKDANSMSVTDEELEAAVQKVYSRVGRDGRRPNGWLALRGDWRVNRTGSPLPELMNDKLMQLLEANVVACYKVPASLFWVGMQNSNQRASRQQDSIDFFNSKISPFLERITSRLSHYLVPKFRLDPKKFRIAADVSEMPLAQYAVLRQYRMYERWWQQNLIQRDRFLSYVNEPTGHLTEEEKKQWYSDTKPAGGLSVGTGSQSTEDNNGLE